MTDTYIIFESDFINIINNGHQKKLSFSEYNLIKVKNDIIFELLKTNLKIDENDNLVLLVSDSYLEMKEVITKKIKSNYEENDNVETYRNFLFNDNSQELPVFNKIKRIFYSGKEINSVQNIPLKSAYYIKDISIELNEEFYAEVVLKLNENNFCVKDILPISTYNSLNKNINHSININLGFNEIVVSEYENDMPVKIKKYNNGFDHIIKQIGNNFNLSYNISKILIEKYGYLIVPSKYVNVVIDIPIIGDFKINIPLTEIAYNLRELYKQILNSISEDFNHIFGNKSHYSCFLTNSINLSGLNEITQLFLGLKIENNTIEKGDIKNFYEVISKPKTYTQKPVQEFHTKNTDKPNILQNILNYCNQKILPLLID